MELTDKVVLVTGGAMGLGLGFGKELLRNGVKALTQHLAILDIANSVGEESVKKLNAEFGEGRVTFVPGDVTNDEEFEAGFVQTIEKFGGLDILINNAGVNNEREYQSTININFTAVVRGTLAGLRYMGKDRGGKGGVIVNVASILGLDPLAYAPVYGGTKHAIVGFSRSFGMPYHYEKNGVRVLTLCPGFTETSIIPNSSTVEMDSIRKTYSFQQVDDVAKGMVQIIRSAESGSVWVVEGGEPVYEVLIPDRFAMKTPTKDQE